MLIHSPFVSIRSLRAYTVKADMPESPQMQKFSQSLPATPKSVSDASNAANAGDDGLMDDGENANDSETIGDDDKADYEYDGEFDDSASDDQQKFVLAPTPAQLGRAPLQRRLGSLVSSDSNSEICARFLFFFLFFVHFCPRHSSRSIRLHSNSFPRRRPIADHE